MGELDMELVTLDMEKIKGKIRILSSVEKLLYLSTFK